MCCCHLACCYRSLPVYLAVIAVIECILGIIRIVIFFSPSSLLINNEKAVVGFILDWISCIVPTLTGLLVALTILIVLCAVLSHLGDSNKVRPVDRKSTGDKLKDLWKNRPLQRLIQLNCNCPCYIARPKLRFVIRLLFLLVCVIFRFIAIGLYSTAGNNTNGSSLAAVCGISMICVFFTFLIDLYQYCVWWHYRPQCDKKCSMLSSKHKRYIPYHLMGYHRTMRLGDKPCPDGYLCNNRRLEHILIFHSFDYKPQPRYCDVRQKTRGENRYIGFHRTTPEAAVSIGHSDFAISTKYESTMLGHGVYFARSMAETEGKANADGAYICAEIEMGRVKQVGPGPERDSLRGTTHLWRKYDTVYYNHPNDDRDEFCVKSTDQILQWVIVVNKHFDAKVRNYKLDTEFEDTKCGCI